MSRFFWALLVKILKRAKSRMRSEQFYSGFWVIWLENEFLPGKMTKQHPRFESTSVNFAVLVKSGVRGPPGQAGARYAHIPEALQWRCSRVIKVFVAARRPDAISDPPGLLRCICLARPHCTGTLFLLPRLLSARMHHPSPHPRRGG